MTQILTERLTKRAQQLDDAQAEKALAFIEFLLAQERFEKKRYEWHIASQEAFARVWDNEHDAIYDNWRELYALLDEKFIAGLDDKVFPDTQSLWIKEAERRFKEIQDGTVVCRPAEEVLRSDRFKLNKP
jgi:hypothetical protein